MKQIVKRALKIVRQLWTGERNLKIFLLEAQRWHGSVLFYRLTNYRPYTRRGIPMTLDSYPYVAGMSFRNRCHLIYDEFQKDDASKITEEDQVIFIKTDLISEFFSTVMPHIQFRANIVTHNSDTDFSTQFTPYLEHEKVSKWYAINVAFLHPKLHSIPIGLAEKKWVHGDTDKIKAAIATKWDKRYTAYVNFNANNCPEEREKVVSLFSNTDWVFTSKRVPFSQYLKDLRRCKYAISPRGVGMDCHRIWESILLGTIPIVKDCPFISHYRDLPILIVEKWEDVTEQLLNHHYESILSRKDLSRLYMDYWIKEIGLLEIYESCAR